MVIGTSPSALGIEHRGVAVYGGPGSEPPRSRFYINVVETSGGMRLESDEGAPVGGEGPAALGKRGPEEVPAELLEAGAGGCESRENPTAPRGAGTVPDRSGLP